MSIKKMLLLASMALAAMAFAIPATASANWTHEGEVLTEEATFEVTGPASFEVGENGAHATVHAMVHLEPGTTGRITDFTVTNCTGTGPDLGGLACTATPQVEDWIIHAKQDGTIEVTDIEVHNQYFHPIFDPNHENPIEQATTLLTGDIKAIPDNNKEISLLTLENINAHVGGVEATINGELAVVGEDTKTYGTE